MSVSAVKDGEVVTNPKIINVLIAKLSLSLDFMRSNFGWLVIILLPIAENCLNKRFFELKGLIGNRFYGWCLLMSFRPFF